MAAVSVVLVLLAAYGVSENTGSRPVEKVAYATGFQMGRDGQESIFVTADLAVDNFARDPGAFFATVAMSIPTEPGMSENPNTALKSVLKQMAAAEPEAQVELIRRFVASYEAGLQQGYGDAPPGTHTED